MQTAFTNLLRGLCSPRTTAASAAVSEIRLALLSVCEPVQGHNRCLWSLLAKLTPAIAPPVATAVPCTKVVNNYTWDDEYSWLEQDTPQTRSFIQREQQYANAVLQRHKKLNRTLQQEFLQCNVIEQDGLPERCGGFWYFTRSGAQIPQFLRRDDEGREQRMLDDEVLSKDQDMLREHFALNPGSTIGSIKVSLDGQLLAYTIPMEDGADRYCGMVKNLKTGSLLPHGVLLDIVSVEFAGDGSTLLYTVPDELGRPAKVVRRSLADGREEEVLQEPDPSCFVEVARSKDGALLTLNINSKLMSEVHVLDAGRPWDAPRLVLPRAHGVEYFVEHQQGHLVILTTAGPALNCRLVSAPLDRPGDWRVLLEERPDVAITDLDMFDGRCVLYERHGGLPRISVLPLYVGQDGTLRAGEPLLVALPDWAATVSPGANQDFGAAVVRLSLSSPVHPETFYDVRLESGQLQHLRTERVPGHDPEHYTCTRWHATSPDGTQVPVTVAHRKGVKMDGQSQLLLLAYGAYGQPLEADFDPVRLALLRRGWVVAFAHVRGGGEQGRRWHAEGRQLHKRNSLIDYLTVADALIAAGYSRAGQMAALATSAGGLLPAAALNLRPELFGAAMLRMPFVDVLAPMADSSQPLTVHEYDEWGDPGEAAQLEQEGPGLIVLCVEESGGHSDARLSHLGSLAEDYAFLLANTGEGCEQ